MPGWAESPFKLITETGIQARPEIPGDHAAVAMARSMALTHNVILRSLNASYQQCLDVRPSQVVDFLRFNQCLCEVLGIHHDVEEEYLFPEIARLSGDPHIMDSNVQDHREFHAVLKAFEGYVYGVRPADYSGQELQRLLEAFGGSVETHLHREIPTLLDLYRYDGSEDLARLGAEMKRRTTSRSSKFR